LALGREWYDEVNIVYKERKTLACRLLDLLDCSYATEQVGMFVWAKIPGKYNNGFELSDEVLQQSNVFITPGGIFGSAGDGYVRISLCSKKEVLAQAIERVERMLENV
jgi:LL-diaminopimelate aminotransferase